MSAAITKKQDYAIKTLYETVKKIDNIENLTFDEINSYLKNPITEKTAVKYFEYLKGFFRQVPDTPENREFRGLLCILITKYCESEAKSNMLYFSREKSRQLKKIVDELKIRSEMVTNLEIENNKLREELKIEKIPLSEVHAGLNVGLIVHDDVGSLNQKECLDFMNELMENIDDLDLTDEKKRLAVPEKYSDAIKRVYAAKTDVPGEIDYTIKKNQV